MLIGLTGLYCAGKNHVAAILEKHGLPVLDADRLGHIVIESQKKAVFGRFGEDLKNPDGSVNRRLLGTRVFGKTNELSALEALVHPEVNRLIEEWVAAQNGKNCVINAALLHKAAIFKKLNCIIMVESPAIVRLIRAKRRDNLPFAVLFQRMKKQKHFFSKYLSVKADIYRVKNPGIGNVPGKTGAGEKLERRIDEILSKTGLKTF